MLGKKNTNEQVTDNQSSLIGEQSKNTLPFSNQSDLQLPDGFTVGKAVGGGDCFFDSAAQGLRQLKPDMEFTVQSLRQVCKNLAVDNQQLKKQVIKDARNPHDPTIIPACSNVSDDELWSAYLASIEYTVEDIERMKIENSHLYQALTNLKYGNTLQIPIWGRPNIEGRMICSAYKVKLHIIENLPHAGWSNQLVDGLASRSTDYVDYSEGNTIHIINSGSSHFQPILRKQILPHCYNVMVSEKKSDSNFQQVSEKDMTDNQMDCEYYKKSSTGIEVPHAKSTVEALGGLDYEDRLSSEELQRRQIQESSTRSSSISNDDTWHSALNDTANGVSLTSDEVTKKATFFVKTFIGELETKLSEFSKEAKSGSKIRKVGKIANHIDSTQKGLFPPIIRAGTDKVSESIGFVSTRIHRRKAKKASEAAMLFKNEMREILVKDSLEIFHSFEEQMTKVMDVSWQKGIEKLAMDAASRVISYISEPDKKGKPTIPNITKGVVLGKSKKNSLSQHLLQKSANLFKLEVFQPGYQIKDAQSDKTWVTSKLYKNTGIRIIEDGIVKYYQLKEHDCFEKYGYRLPFAWELENLEELKQKYILSEPPKARYVYILDEEKKKKLADSILKEINGESLAQKKDIEELRVEIKNLRIHHKEKDKNTRPLPFELGSLPEFFITKDMMLSKLDAKLRSKNQEVEMSRMVLINGKYGTGKSELARSYGYNKGSNSNAGENVVWINAETYDTLSNSFRDLAERLKISNDNVVRDREIKSIVKNVYEKFQDVESLFIFDNASNYDEVKKFLPSHFSDLFFGKEKPYTLITSRNKNWKEGIEKIELNDGFSPAESMMFFEKILGIQDIVQSHHLVDLIKALGYLPLALKQAAAYIRQEKISISEYLKRYNEAMQEATPDRLEALGVTKELFTTLKLNLDKIRGEENIGQQSNDIVAYMAYLSPNQIDIEEIFLQKKSEKDKQQILDVLDRLQKFSVIELEESIARVHKGVQNTIRVEKEQAGTEEETLRTIMTSFCLTSTDHITSVWSHVSKYSKLVNEFIDSLYDGGTVLHLLAKYGNEKVIKLILEKIDPKKLSKVINALDEEDLTALDYAAMYGHLDIVKYFIEKGSNLYDYNDEFAPLHWAAICGQLEIVKYFVDNGYLEFDKLSEEDNATLYYAVKYGHLDIIKYFVEKWDSMNLHNLDGISPVHLAAESGHLNIVKYLIEKGICVNLQDIDGMSSVHWAAKDGHLNIAKYLIEKRASIDLMDKNNMSPMHWAAHNGHLDIVKYLVEEGGNIDLKDKYGMSPVYYAIVNGHLGITEYLFKQGAKMNLTDDYDNTPLDCAVLAGNLDTAEYLLKQGAKMDQRSKDFLCHYANANGYSDIIRYLKAYPTVYSASNLKTQSRKKQQKAFDEHTLPKKRRLENMSATSEENASNIQLLQGSQNLPSDISMRFEGESTVNLTNRIPMFSFNSVAVEPVNNKSLRR